MGDEIRIGIPADASSATAELQQAADSTKESTSQMQESFQQTNQICSAAMEKAAESISEAAELIRESLTTLEEKEKETAEESEEAFAAMREAAVASMEGVNAALARTGGAFGAFGAAIGAGIFVEFVDHMKEQVLETNHLAEATGISVVQLTEFKDAMTQAGSSTERLPQQLTKLSQAMTQAAEGGKEQQAIFKELGVNTKDWAKEMPNPITVLQQMSDHMHETEGNAKELAAVSLLLGRGSVGMAAFLKQGSAAIKEQMNGAKEHGQQMQASVNAAQDLQRAQAQMKESIEGIALPAFRTLTDVIQGSRSVWYGLETVIYAAATSMMSLYEAQLKVQMAFTHLGPGMSEFRNVLQGQINDAEKWKTQLIQLQKAAVEGFDKANQDIARAMTSRSEILEKGGGETRNKNAAKEAAAALKAQMDAWQEEFAALKAKDGVALDEEVNFWEDKLAIVKRGTAQYKSVYLEISKLIAEENKKAEEFNKSADAAFEKETQAHLKKDEEEVKKSLEQKSKMALEYAKSLNTAAQLEQQDERVAAMDSLKEQELYWKDKLSLGEISGKQELQHLKEIHAEEYALQLKAMQDQLALMKQAQAANQFGSPLFDPTLPAKIAQMNSQISALNRQAMSQQQNDTRASLQMQEGMYKNFFDQINKGMDTAISGWIQGTQTFGQAMKKMLASIIVSEVEFVAQWLLKKAEMWAMDAVLAKTSQSLSASQQVMSAAAVAYANAFAATAAIPIVGPELAPMAGMAAMMDVMSMMGMAQLDSGGQIPHDGVAMLHQGEIVTPAPTAEMMMSMMGKGGGSDNHFHIGGNNFHGGGDEDMLRKHEHRVIKDITRLQRLGRIKK